MENFQPSAEMELMRMILEKWISQPIHVVAELGVPDLLLEGERSVRSLAEKTRTDAESLYRLMRALASVGIFSETSKKTFANTPMSECLTAGRMRAAARLFHAPWHDKVWSGLLDSIRSGQPAFERVHGEPLFDWLEHHPEAAAVFHEASSRKAAATHGVILDVIDFSSFHVVMDVGGGTGGLVFAILSANPHLQAIVADRKEVITRIESEGGAREFSDRVQLAEIDFFRAVPVGSDAIILSHVLHDWPDESCGIILDNCRKALPKDGRLLVVESILPGGNDFGIAKLMDLEVFLMGGGKERTERQYMELYKTAKFQCLRTNPTAADVAVMECVAV